MKWSEEETVKFLELYTESECLWNVVSPLYKDKHLRLKAIEAIVNEMKKDGFGVQEAKQKIKNIRSTFNQELLKVRKSSKSRAGSIDVYIPTIKWFHIVKPIMKMVKGSNITSNNLETENIESEVNQDQDDDTYDFQQPETANIEPVASVSPNPRPKLTDTNKQESTSKPKPPKRKLQELSYAVKELKSVSEILAQPQPNEPEHDEIDIFGKYVTKSLKTLSAIDAICAQQEIQGLTINQVSIRIYATPKCSFISDSVGSHSPSNEYEIETMDGTELYTVIS